MLVVHSLKFDFGLLGFFVLMLRVLERLSQLHFTLTKIFSILSVPSVIGGLLLYA